MVLPRYPVYIPSKSRADRCVTAKHLAKDGVPFYLVVEPQEFDQYAAVFGAERVLTLPFSNRGTSTPARNWIKDHATAAGHLRHWQLDDNMYGMYRTYHGKRLRCRAGLALSVVEDFTDRYENIAVAGLNYTTFVIPRPFMPPIVLNVHVYSCSLVLNSLPTRWRPRYNEDTDFCLQVLADGWCTVLFNAFSVKKIQTLTMRGGNASIYQNDGRLQMARSLERDWPGVVEVRRRFNRPQHSIKYAWRRFDTPLKRKPDIDFEQLAAVDDYGMTLQPAFTEKSST